MSGDRPTAGKAISPAATVEPKQLQPALDVHQVVRDDAAAEDGACRSAAPVRDHDATPPVRVARSIAITCRFGASLSVRR